MLFDDFFAALFAGLAEDAVVETAAAAFFLAQRAPANLARSRRRSSGVGLSTGPYLRQIGSSLDVHERSDLFYLF